MSEIRYIRNPDVVLREEDPDGALLFNPDTNQIRVINPTGLFVWNRCDGNHTFPQIISEMKEAFEDVPEGEVETHIGTFINDMKENGFIGTEASQKKEH